MQRSSKTGKNKRKRPRKSAPSRRPIRWTELPHQELYQRVLNAMSLGSRERASEDSLKHVLKRRLPELDRDDHRRYIEIECHKIVETLRAMRDEYRRYLQQEGCKPISEMYWVVFRFGVMQYAVSVLREIASEYLICTKVPCAEWEILYGDCFLPTFPVAPDSSVPETPRNPSSESVTDVIRGLIRVKLAILRELQREGQVYLTRRHPGFSFWGPGVDLLQILKNRQLLWEKCNPWTTGLSQLFDSTQEELNFQYSLLAGDAKRAESAFIKLSAFEKIAHEYLVDMRRGRATSRNLGESDWLKVLDALDKCGITIDAELAGTPKQVLEAVRRRGHQIATWKECYQSQLRVIMDNGKMHSLRREVTHAVHNAAKKAAYQLAKIWNLNT